MKYIFPRHIGSGNRGCEGIIKGLYKILDGDANHFVIYDSSYSDFLIDKHLLLDDIGELQYNLTNKYSGIPLRILSKLGWNQPYYSFLSDYYLKKAEPGDIVLITGGDGYCYKNGGFLSNNIAAKAKRKNIRVILCCNSFEKRYLTPEIINGLENYDMILTRESFSEATLNSYGIKNTLVPDPAFTLGSTPVSLPAYFDGRIVVGLNFSSFTNSSEFFEKNIMKLCHYLESIGIDVCLIPHVFWKNQDDRVVMKRLLPNLGKNVHFLDCSKLSYQQIRYVISQCKYFIGGRTHACISAYASKVPCIALSYSVKSKGIAHDIGIPDYTVIDSLKMQDENELLNAFKELMDDEAHIKEIYSSMNQYVSHCYDAKKLIVEERSLSKSV